MTFIISFKSMLSLLIMILIGWYCAKIQLLDEDANQKISSVVLKVLNPMLSLSAASTTAAALSLKEFGLASMISLSMFVFYILLATLTAKYFYKETNKQMLYKMMFVFSNLGFIGMPVVRSILGEPYTKYVSAFMLMFIVVFYTYGVVLVNGKIEIKKMLNTGNFFWLLSMLIILFKIQLPNFLLTPISYFGNATTPLALMLVGYTLSQIPMKELLGDAKLYIFTAMKMIVLPLILYHIVCLFPINDALAKVSLILFGMPVGNLPLLMATEKGIDSRLCTSGIVITSILCVITIPITLWFAGISL